MRGLSAWVLAGIVAVLAQERTWTRELKDRAKRDGLHDATQLVRGDSGKWNDDPRLQHAPPIARKPVKVSLDDWADQLLEKPVPLTPDDESWLIFRGKQLDDNDRVWVERIERRENRITVVAHLAKWQGRYFKTFTFYPVIAVNLGKLEAGKYDVRWVVKPLAFSRFEGDGRPANNWPKDERPTDRKSTELSATFEVGQGSRTEDEKAKLTKLVLAQASQALDLFKLDHNRYPERLADLLTMPKYVDAKKWPPGGYLKHAFRDGWGRELVYRVPGTNGQPYDVISLGSDGREGGEGPAEDLWNHEASRKK